MNAKTYNSVDEFINDIQNDNADTRYAAWSQAKQMNEEAIPKLVELMGSDHPGIAQAATNALQALTHSSAEWGREELRLKVVGEWMKRIGESNPSNVRVLAFRLLAKVGDERVVSEISTYLYSPYIREEALFCLQNISISTAATALIAALRNSPDDFKPRLIAALGYRRDDEAVDTLYDYLSSSDTELAMAAMHAIARIGKLCKKTIPWPNYARLSSHDQNRFLNCLIEYAENLLQKGHPEEAARSYLQVLDKTNEEHFCCAAILGLSKINNPIAVQAMKTMASHPSYKVRDVIKKVLNE